MQTREFEIRNRHGKRLSSTISTPEGEPKGTVVLLHGLAGWKDQETLRVMRDAAVEAGYQTLSFNGSDSLRGPDASFWRGTTTGFIEDMEDALAYARTESCITGPLILAGHSLGALAAVRYAKRHPMLVQRLVLVAPAISFLTDSTGRIRERIRTAVRRMRRLKELEEEMGERFVLPLYPPWVFDYLKYDTRRDALQVEIPVLIISAGEDEIVAGPRAHEHLANMFTQAEHVVIPNARHLFDEHEDELAATISAWLT